MGWEVTDGLWEWVDFEDTVHITRGGETPAIGTRTTMEPGAAARSGSGIITSPCARSVNSVFNDAALDPSHFRSLCLWGYG